MQHARNKSLLLLLLFDSRLAVTVPTGRVAASYYVSILADYILQYLVPYLLTGEVVRQLWVPAVLQVFMLNTWNCTGALCTTLRKGGHSTVIQKKVK